MLDRIQNLECQECEERCSYGSADIVEVSEDEAAVVCPSCGEDELEYVGPVIDDLIDT